jgi:DtxR family Mn-dependent transcriptional regulator
VRGGVTGRILGGLQSQGMIKPKGDVWVLTEDGRQMAMEVVRRHRLYETWLAREKGVPADQWHRKADAAEHGLDLEATNALADRLGNPRFDPHGDPIPTREGDLPIANRISLAEWNLERSALIEHIEDEPISMYRKIVKSGLHAGMMLSGMEKLSDGGVRVIIEGRALDVAPELLGLVHVGEIASDDEEPKGLRRLSELDIGEEGQVYGLSAGCYGPERRRLLDLGVVPGTKIRCEFQSPFGSPRSYLIRGTLFGFRDEQADKILLTPAEKLDTK